MGYLKIQKNIYNNYMFCETPLRFKSSYRLKDFKHYDSKLDNSISRARSNIFNIAMFNKFDYFYTQTISSKFNRKDLLKFISKFRRTIKYMRSLCNDNYKYLIVPEFHLDGECYHLHGFIDKSFEKFFFINKNGFTDIKYLCNLGFVSVQPIKNYEACIKYFTKYITKDLCKSRNKGEHIYYCSRGLKRENVIFKGESDFIFPIHYFYKSNFVFKSTCNQTKLGQ